MKLVMIVILLLVGCQRYVIDPLPTAIPEPITSNDLAKALLTLDDLPTGWTMGPVEIGAEEKSTVQFLCKENPYTTIERAFSLYQSSTFGPFLRITIRIKSDPLEGIKTHRQTLDECNGTYEDDQNAWSYSPMSFPKLGDDIAATRFISEKGAMVDGAYIRQGVYSVSILHIGHQTLSPIDSTDTARYAEIVLDRLQ